MAKKISSTENVILLYEIFNILVQFFSAIYRFKVAPITFIQNSIVFLKQE